MSDIHDIINVWNIWKDVKIMFRLNINPIYFYFSELQFFHFDCNWKFFSSEQINTGLLNLWELIINIDKLEHGVHYWDGNMTLPFAVYIRNQFQSTHQYGKAAKESSKMFSLKRLCSWPTQLRDMTNLSQWKRHSTCHWIKWHLLFVFDLVSFSMPLLYRTVHINTKNYETSSYFKIIADILNVIHYTYKIMYKSSQ